MDKQKTSPYSLYQFLINIEDTEVQKLMLSLTFLSEDEISEIMEQHSQNTEHRIAQKRLASEVTEIVHGKDALTEVIQSTETLFGIHKDMSPQ